jgi:hypothetical protein
MLGWTASFAEAANEHNKSNENRYFIQDSLDLRRIVLHALSLSISI